MSFDVSGLNELMARLRNMSNQGKEIEEKALKAGAQIFRDQIEENTPVYPFGNDHGKDFIVVGEVKEGTVPIGPDGKHYYLRFPEFGTSKQPAQGFIERAFNDKKSDAQQAIVEVINEELGL
jgi:HK97 gp10 family phage protein